MGAVGLGAFVLALPTFDGAVQIAILAQLRTRGATVDGLQVHVTPKPEGGSIAHVTYRGLRGFAAQDGTPVPANGEFDMEYVGAARWEGRLGGTLLGATVGVTDNIDLPFVDDPAVIGDWQSVDFIADPATFDPAKRQWGHDLFFKELHVLPHGRTPQPWFTWTKGFFLHAGDKTASRYDIRQISGQTYMFFEWKSGDVTILGRKPLYYVLKKSAKAENGTMVDMAESGDMTWITTFYSRATSRDGKKTWLVTEDRPQAYKAPGMYRETHLDKQGQVRSVTITDSRHKRELWLNPEKKQATLTEMPFAMQDERGPFVGMSEILKRKDLQWVKTVKVDGREVNVFRHAFRDESNGRDWSYDFWVDQKTKRLVEVHVPGDDIYNPETDPDRNTTPDEAWGRRQAIGSVHRAIVYDAKLDDSLFRMEAPQGYAMTKVGRPQVTEQDMIDYLGILADFNGRVFPDQVIPFAFSSDRKNAVWGKPKEQRTAAEQKLLDTESHYMEIGLNSMPLGQFIDDAMAAGSFRYIGRGVKLGDGQRIVCWYQLKDARDYRAVYGDLSVKSVPQNELPLPAK